MDMQNKKLETQADLLAEESLHEHDSTPFDELDDYAKQCNYAGCYPWLPEVICAHPYDSVILSGLWTSERTEEEADFFC
jgi:hypothetical protein